MVNSENFISQKIVEVMSPFFGNIMAQSIMESQCKRLKIDPDNLTFIDLPRISQSFTSHIDIFVGSQKAREIANRLMMIQL